MCTIPPLGAINKATNQYVYPSIANKQDKYICPECNKDLIIRQGDIRIHHFAHIRDDNPCTYYNRPSESQIHKDAKLLLKRVLDDKKEISIERECIGLSSTYNCPFSSIEVHTIPIISESSNIHIEYRFEYNGIKIADVAYIDDNEIVCLFEIYNKHKTDEQNRPEPWFEIDAYELINTVNSSNINTYTLKCIRKLHCNDCKDALTTIKCARCNEQVTKVMTSQSYVIKEKHNRVCIPCKQFFEKNKIWLNISYSDKDIFKQYGGKWDSISKKWYIDKNNPNKNEILLRWKVLI